MLYELIDDNDIVIYDIYNIDLQKLNYRYYKNK